jgi:hypothetical protein
MAASSFTCVTVQYLFIRLVTDGLAGVVCVEEAEVVSQQPAELSITSTKRAKIV